MKGISVLTQRKCIAIDFEKESDEKLEATIKVLSDLDEEVMREIVAAEEEVKKVKNKLGNIRNNRRVMQNVLKGRKHYRFKEDLFKEYGNGLPREQLEKIFSKAYERGHSSGEHEVKNEFIDLMDLFE